MSEHYKVKQVTATEAANRFGTLVDEAGRGSAVFVVARRGHPKAVIMGLDVFQELIHRFETDGALLDPESLAEIAKTAQGAQIGQPISFEQLRDTLRQSR